MNFRKMSSEIAKLEGKKRQVSIGNIREVLKITLHLLGKELLEIPDDNVLVAFHNQLIHYGKKKMK